ncbi:hypothetical protein [Desulfosporosinus sp.]|nr:hypothetical protein [Desulfosporosinus sp.]
MSYIIVEIQQVQLQTEDMYIHSQDREFILFKSGKGKDSDHQDQNE